jgi:hypothetical protein
MSISYATIAVKYGIMAMPIVALSLPLIEKKLPPDPKDDVTSPRLRGFRSNDWLVDTTC